MRRPAPRRVQLGPHKHDDRIGSKGPIFACAALFCVLVLAFLVSLSGGGPGGSDHPPAAGISDDSAAVLALAAKVEVLQRELEMRGGHGHEGAAGGGAGGPGFGAGGGDERALADANKGLGATLGPFRLRNRRGEVVPAFLPSSRAELIEVNFTVPYDEAGEKKWMNMFVMGTSTTPPFAAVLAHPRNEAASEDVFLNGDMEIPTRLMFEFFLKKKCAASRALGKPMTVLDAGANLGYFSTYSAVMGCDVVSVEMQPRLIPIIKAGPIVNGVSSRHRVHNNIIYQDASQRISVQYANGKCWGCGHANKLRDGAEVPKGQDLVKSARLDQLVDKDLVLFKIDVEGYETNALESALNLLKTRTVENLLIEWAPINWPRSVEEGTEVMLKLYDMGYTVRGYNLRWTRLQIPAEWTTQETWPLIGPTWIIPRERALEFNSYLKKNKGRGEANLWISKTHPPQSEGDPKDLLGGDA